MTSDLPALKGVTEDMLDPATLAALVVFLASDLAKELNGRVLLAHGGTIGALVTEFKMKMADGYIKKAGAPTAREIAENLNKVLFSDPDLDMMACLKFN